MSKIVFENASVGTGTKITRRQLKAIMKLAKHQDVRVLDHPNVKAVEVYQGDHYAEHTRYHIEPDGTVGLTETDVHNTGEWVPK
jgi:hypothetical protein